jgi:alcohol dehydrogenase-like protein
MTPETTLFGVAGVPETSAEEGESDHQEQRRRERWISRLRLPLWATPGSECAGRVVAVGAGGTSVKPGDLVSMLRENWTQQRTSCVRARNPWPDASRFTSCLRSRSTKSARPNVSGCGEAGSPARFWRPRRRRVPNGVAASSARSWARPAATRRDDPCLDAPAVLAHAGALPRAGLECLRVRPFLRGLGYADTSIPRCPGVDDRSDLRRPTRRSSAPIRAAFVIRLRL